MRMKARKKILPILLAVVMAATMAVPKTALAASEPNNFIFDVSEGSVTINDAGSGELTVTYGTPSTTTAAFPNTQNITITGTTTRNHIEVSNGVTTNITMENVNIDWSNYGCAFYINDNSIVNLTLKGVNFLTSGDYHAGLRVTSTVTLTIGGTGALTSIGGLRGAGIGGVDHTDCGSITINSGTITAKGVFKGGINGAAGIGGGAFSNGGTITINGGTVTAIAGGVMGGGAGIGGGYKGSGGTITINGGTVTADGGTSTGDGGGAGIGGGYQGGSGTITISGGTIIANGCLSSPGIGCGNEGNGGEVYISGGSVKATGDNAPPIGGTNVTLENNSSDKTKVFLTTVTLDGASAETAVSNLTTDPSYSYGMKDMFTGTGGKLYLYLPENTKTTAAQTSAARYTGDITTTADHNAADTLIVSPAIYTISYNANGGSGTMADDTATQGVAFTLPPNGFIAPEGKQFKEWAIGSTATGARVAAGESYTFTAPTTVYAVWTDTTLPTVTSVTPDGTGAPVSGNIVITFSEAMDTTAAGAVYLSDDSGTTYGSALTGGSWSTGDTVYTIPYSGLSYSTLYTVKIEGFEDAAGNTMATDSTHSFTTCDEPLVPSVSPSTLTVDKGGTASFTVAFGQGTSRATSADITVANGGIASLSQTQVTTSGSVTVTGLAVGTTDITVVFNDTASTTATVSVTVQPVAPAWPSGSTLTASGVTRTSATLTWTAAADITAVTGYKLYRDGTEIATVAGDVYSYTVTGLSPATSYTFQVQAGNADGKWSTNGPTFTVQTRSSGGSGGGSSSTPSKSTYTANVKADNGADTTLPVTVNMDTGSAAVNVGTQQGNTISGGGNVTVTMPSIPGVSSYSLGIPAACLTTPGGGSLTFDTDTGSITLRADMLAGISEAEGKNAEITIGQGDKSGLPDSVKAAIGDRPLIQLSLTLDGKQTDWSNPDAPVTVSIPYVPTAEELANPEGITVYYIDGSGNMIEIAGAKYDPKTKAVVFQTTHFSYYAVGYKTATAPTVPTPIAPSAPTVQFSDVLPGAWYYDAVSFCAAKGITTGTGNGKFSPDATLTRGQFITMLLKAYGIEPIAAPADNFADAGDTYYTGYLAAAKARGITNGVGDNKFAPEKAITRQEMFTLLYNALKVIGQLPPGDSGKTLSDFIDANSVAEWAKESMGLLVKTGIIGGNLGKLSPTSTATRAEMAQILYQLI